MASCDDRNQMTLNFCWGWIVLFTLIIKCVLEWTIWVGWKERLKPKQQKDTQESQSNNIWYQRLQTKMYLCSERLNIYFLSTWRPPIQCLNRMCQDMTRNWLFDCCSEVNAYIKTISSWSKSLLFSFLKMTTAFIIYKTEQKSLSLIWCD